MKNSQQINWGIMGPGIIARKLADALKLNKDCRLYAVASKTPARAEKFAKEYSIKNVLTYQEIVEERNVDVIYVATTHNYHYQNAKIALEHDKHVLIEKPFTVNAKEARDLVRIARKKQLFLMEAMWVRFLPSILLLRKVIQGDEVGRIQFVNVSFGGFVKSKYEKRLKRPELAGGVTLDMGVYPISYICYLLGELPQEIKSVAVFSDLGVDERAGYLFRFPSGCLANIATSFNLKMNNHALIYGEQGFIESLQFMKAERFTVYLHDGQNEIKETVRYFEKNHRNGFIYQVEEVVRCLKEGKLESDIMSLEETIGIMEIMDTMREDWKFKYPFE
jgi:predicted dehydrogenase